MSGVLLLAIVWAGVIYWIFKDDPIITGKDDSGHDRWGY